MVWGDVFVVIVFGIELEIIVKLEVCVNGGVVVWVNCYLYVIVFYDRFIIVVVVLLLVGRCFIGVFIYLNIIVLQIIINVVGFGYIYGYVVELVQWWMVVFDLVFVIVIRDIDIIVIIQNEVFFVIRIDLK